MPEITGRLVKELHEPGNLYVSVGLNMTDGSTQNLGKADPILLRDVVRVDGKSAWKNAVLVDAGSVIELHIRSKGPWGYGLHIETDHEKIVDKLFVTTESGEEATTFIQASQNTGLAMKVDDFATMGLTTEDEKQAYWSCRIVTWDVLGWAPDGTNDWRGQSRGDVVKTTVIGGALHTEGASSQKYGKVKVNDVGPDQPNGYLSVWFFVFKDAIAKAAFYEAYETATADDM